MVAGRRLDPSSTPASGGWSTLRALPEVFQYTRQALDLVWATSHHLTIALALLTLVAGVLPAAIAFVGARIVDAVVAAIATHAAGGGDLSTVLDYVALEGVLVRRSRPRRSADCPPCQSLLRAQLGQRVNEMILEKALTLELRHFEDSEFYDKLTRARREASSRPLSLVMRTLRPGAERASRWSASARLLVRLLALGRGGAAARRPARPSSPKPSSPATRSACSAGARPRRACRCTSRRCWRARITPRK